MLILISHHLVNLKYILVIFLNEMFGDMFRKKILAY